MLVKEMLNHLNKMERMLNELKTINREANEFLKSKKIITDIEKEVVTIERDLEKTCKDCEVREACDKS